MSFILSSPITRDTHRAEVLPLCRTQIDPPPGLCSRSHSLLESAKATCNVSILYRQVLLLFSPYPVFMGSSVLAAFWRPLFTSDRPVLTSFLLVSARRSNASACMSRRSRTFLFTFRQTFECIRMHESAEGHLLQILSTYHRMVTHVNFCPDFNLVCICHLTHLQSGGLREADVRSTWHLDKDSRRPNSSRRERSHGLRHCICSGGRALSEIRK
jgi:hypothetical protein